MGFVHAFCGSRGADREEPDDRYKAEAQTGKGEGLGDKARTTLRWAAALRPKRSNGPGMLWGESQSNTYNLPRSRLGKRYNLV